MSFDSLGLAENVLRAVSAEGYHDPTSIQSTAIPLILAGRDVLGCAQTGTGKTAAFALPTLHRLSQAESRVNGRGRKIRSLVLSPTRELAVQIGDSFRTYGRHTPLRYTTIYGGVGQMPQVKALNHGVDVVIATPGRLLDLMNQGYVDLRHVQILVLDEADRMLDMGFIHDLRRIVSQTPEQRQTLLFSATMPDNIRELARQWLREPANVCVTPVSSTREQIAQSVFMVEKREKMKLLGEWLRTTAWTRTLVFTRTKHGADRVAKQLRAAGIAADAMHGNKSHAQRQHALARFKSPKPAVLVATDIAARGLDIDNISHVVNFDMPVDAETYVHRIGRTGRASGSGVAVSFCDSEERAQLRDIERLTRQRLVVERNPEGINPGGAGGREAAQGPRSQGDGLHGKRPHGRRRQSNGPDSNRSSHGKRFNRHNDRRSRRRTASAGEQSAS